MCACRCGIKVHLKDGKVRYIQGNPDHPVNMSFAPKDRPASCSTTPRRVSKPLRRVGDRGSGEFKEIEWDEAIRTAVEWLKLIRESDPKKLAFFTGRDQKQAMGWWATQFGAKLRGAWWFLFRQHGDGRHILHRWFVLGIWRADWERTNIS